MSKKNNLIIGRAIFTMFIIISFGLIIMSEKGGELFIPKIKQKIDDYIDTNYADIKETLKMSDIIYKDKEYKVKITANNKKYFYITYYKGKITDTYKEDYIEGKNILNDIENNIENKIKNKTKTTCKIKLIKNINEYSEKIQEKILNEDFINLKIYYIEKELTINNWTSEEINKEITNFINNLYINDITPKYYKITIIDKNNIVNEIEITNIDESFITNKDNEQIIDDIINNINSDLLKENKITYKYLN